MRFIPISAVVVSSLVQVDAYVHLRPSALAAATTRQLSQRSRAVRPFTRSARLWVSMSGSYEDGNDDTGSGSVSVNWDWERMASDVFSEDKRPIVLFDGVCNLCNGGVNFAMDQDETAKFRFCSLQSRVAQSLLLRSGKSPDDKSNIALITEDGAFFSSDAVSRICMDLDAVPLQWFGQLGQYTPPWIRESIYKFVSENRYQFGENDSCRLDFDGTYTSRFVSDPSQEGAESS